jgi:rod shape determining protein RodA
LLATLGVFFIRSAQRASPGGVQWETQLLWLAIGAALYVGVASFDYHVWLKNAWLVYGGGILLLILLWSPLGEVRSGARRWLGVGSLTIQPSEFAKIGTLVMLSFVLAKSELGTIRDSLAMLGKVALIVAVPMMLIFLQPDLGSSLALFPTVFALLYVSNLSARFFVTVFGLFIVAMLVLNRDIKHYEAFQQAQLAVEGKISFDDYNKFLQARHVAPVKGMQEYEDAFAQAQQKQGPNLTVKTYAAANHIVAAEVLGQYEKQSWLPLKNYQRDRIASFLDPEDVDPQGIGVTWNQKQSQIAVGTGGLTCKGYQNGTQARLGYLPTKVASSDFIMAVFLEETGFIGGLAVIGLYAILLGNTLRIAWLARDRFGRLLCVGVAMLFMVHVFVNIGMVQGLMPVKGIPLPLMSYGGSFVLGCCILMGLVQSVHRYSREAV